MTETIKILENLGKKSLEAITEALRDGSRWGMMKRVETTYENRKINQWKYRESTVSVCLMFGFGACLLACVCVRVCGVGRHWEGTLEKDGFLLDE